MYTSSLILIFFFMRTMVAELHLINLMGGWSPRATLYETSSKNRYVLEFPYKNDSTLV